MDFRLVPLFLQEAPWDSPPLSSGVLWPLGVAHCLGSIEAGKKADFLICNDDLTVKEVYRDGKKIY